MAINLKTTSTLASNGAKLLVYGQAGAGKTTLAATLPAPIILSAEGGLLSIQDANLPYIEVTSMAKAAQTAKFASWLTTNRPEIAAKLLAN